MKKKKNVLILIGLTIAIISFIGVSYAFWVLNFMQTKENNILSSCFNITFDDSNDINLEKAYPISDEEGKKLTPYRFSIENRCDEPASFDINLEVLNTTTLPNLSVVKAMLDLGADYDNSLAPQSLKKNDAVVQQLDANVNSLETLSYDDTIIDLLSNFDETSKTLENATTSFKLTTGYLTPHNTKKYSLRLWIDEKTSPKMEGIKNAKFSSKVVVNTKYYPTIPGKDVLSYVKENADSSSYDVYTVPEIVNNSCTYTLAYDGTTDNNLRYVGANPCNYVKIDDEYWRIVGLMNNIDDGTGKKETRIKLMRYESIGKYSWDTSESSINNGKGVNEWSEADLMKLLNPGYESESVGGSLYYNGGYGECYYGQNNATTACDFTTTGLKPNLKALIGDVVWNTGSNSWNSELSEEESEDYLNSHSHAYEFYSYERSNNIGKVCSLGDGCNDTVKRTTTWNGKIGLMYPSDYGYATSGGPMLSRSFCLDENLFRWFGPANDCIDNVWLYNSVWLLMPSAMYDTSSSVLGSPASNVSFIHPTVYLKANVTILNGSGSYDNPYEIGF